MKYYRISMLHEVCQFATCDVSMCRYKCDSEVSNKNVRSRMSLNAAIFGGRLFFKWAILSTYDIFISNRFELIFQ